MFIKFNSSAKVYSRLDDEELLKKIVRENDHKAIEEIFNRYTHLLYGVCLKYLKDTEQSKDAVMEVFHAALEKVHSTEIKNFKAWIYTITKNHCLMQLRKTSSFNRLKNGILENFLSEIMESDIEMNLINEESESDSEENLNKALAQLKKEQEVCIRMMYLENKSYKEIAGITGYSLNEVKSFIQNGKRNLKILILNNNGKNK